MNKNSPFYVISDFISPLMCEQILDVTDFLVPDHDIHGDPIKTIKTSDIGETIIYQRLVNVFPELMAHYQFTHKGTERISFEWFPEGTVGQFVCENSSHLRGKWLRTKSRDITAILFLSDYQDKMPFEQDYEVYGGKLEFVQHHFGFNPTRGTLIAFPSDPHFINMTSEILAGELFQARIQIAAKHPYIYMPDKFPGDYTTWFADQLLQTDNP